MDKEFTKKFIKGIATTGFGTFFQISLGLISMIIAIRYLSKADYGIFILLEVIVVLLAVLGSLGLENLSVIKLMAGSDDSRKILIANTAVSYRFLISIFLALLIIPLKPFILYVFKSEQLIKLTYFISIFIILTGFQELFLKILQAYHKYKEIAVSQILSGFLRLGSVCLFIVALNMKAAGLILVYLVTLFGSIIYLGVSIPFKKRFILDFGIIKELFHFGFPLGLNNILSFIFMKIDRIMLGMMLSPMGVASYEVASRIPDNIARMYTAFQAVYFPNLAELFAKNKKIQAEKVLNNSIRIISFLTIFAAVVGLLFQKEIIVLLFSKKYIDSSSAFALLMFCFSIALMGDILGTSLVALGQSDKPVKINIVDTVFNVTGNLLLIPKYGIMGAVFATLVSRVVTNPFIVYFLKKAGVNIRFRNYLKPILLFLFIAFFTLIFPPKAIMVRLLIIAVFLGLSFLLSLVKIKDIKVLLQKHG
ncbi:MAG: flippase [bacterium]|nr:flippase [bacterium]